MNNKFLLNEFELRRTFKRLLNEGFPNFKTLMGLIGKSSDDFVKILGDDAVKNIETVLTRAFSNKLNVGVNKAGQQVIKGPAGGELRLESLSSILDGVIEGDIILDEVLNKFPQYLPDGSEFRSVFDKALRQKASTNLVKQSVSSTKIGPEGQKWLKLMEEINWGNWWTIEAKSNISGWKFHIFSENINDSAALWERLKPIAEKYGAEFKVATQANYDAFIPNPYQKGKGATIYIPADVVRNNKQEEFLRDVQNAISDYTPSGSIDGDLMMTKNIGLRYELNKPIDPKIGVSPEGSEYRAMYQSQTEGSNYNVPNNPDIF